MSLARTSLLNGISVAVRMAATLVVNKLAALYVGPHGFAMVGQLQNALTLLTSLGAGALSTGVTKFTAEYAGDPHRQRVIWRTSGTLTLVAPLALGAGMLVWRKELSSLLLGSGDFAEVIGWLAVSLCLIGVNTQLLAILNGSKEVWRYVQCNIGGSIVLLVLSTALIWQLQLKGALLALALSQAVSALVTTAICLRAPWFRFSDLIGRINWGACTALLKFVAMACTSAIAAPLIQIAIRGHLTASFGAEHAGYWDAANRLSNAALSLATMTLAVYYLPRFAEITTYSSLESELKRGMRTVLPICAAVALLLYLLRHTILGILYSAEFAPAEQLMGWQVAGDVVKIGSWLMAYVLIGKAMATAYIISEIVFSVTLLLLTLACTKLFGFVGVSAAYFANYCLYGLSMYAMLRGPLKQRMFEASKTSTLSVEAKI